MSEETTTLPAWLTEAEEDMASQQSDFSDIEKGLYVLELTGWDGMKPDKNDQLRCQLELTIIDKDENGESKTFDNRKIWPSAGLEGDSFKYLMKRLMWAWVKRNPKKIAFLGVLPDNPQQWGEYLDACKADPSKGQAGLTAIANVKPKKQTQAEKDAGYNTKYDVYVSADQTADQSQEEPVA